MSLRAQRSNLPDDGKLAGDCFAAANAFAPLMGWAPLAMTSLSKCHSGLTPEPSVITEPVSRERPPGPDVDFVDEDFE